VGSCSRTYNDCAASGFLPKRAHLREGQRLHAVTAAVDETQAAASHQRGRQRIVAKRLAAEMRRDRAHAVPGIAFLSGGQSDEEATAHLDAINCFGGLPWKVTFSYGRALQAAPQKAWSGRSENVAAAQRAYSHRARMNGLATRGEWKADLEKKAA